MTNKLTIYPSDTVLAVLGDDDSVSTRLHAICDRYMQIISHARITERFTRPELKALIDCCRQIVFDPAYIIDSKILDAFNAAINDGMAEKWRIDAQAMSEKLHGLQYHELVALAEIIETYWRGFRIRHR